MRTVAEEPSKATSTVVVHRKVAARRHRDALKQSLEQVDYDAELIAADLNLGDKLLPRDAYIGAPGTYARHVYNILRDVAGR